MKIFQNTFKLKIVLYYSAIEFQKTKNLDWKLKMKPISEALN